MRGNYTKEDLETNEKIELEHILLEIKHNRGQHLRHFIDQYFCYKNEYVTANCKPVWDKINWNEYVSEEAENNPEIGTTRDHIVPLNILTHLLLNLGKDATTDVIQKILNDYLCFATITKEENQKLNDAGLKSKMPEKYYENGKLKKNFEKLSRYSEAKIKINYTNK